MHFQSGTDLETGDESFGNVHLDPELAWILQIKQGLAWGRKVALIGQLAGDHTVKRGSHFRIAHHGLCF